MIFLKDQLYHTYNRGIAGKKIFINYENYIFFLRKIRNHLLKHCSIIAYCLMPDHFHLMIYVSSPEIVIQSDTLKIKNRSINSSIGILLRSYTRALQKQEKFTGSLFQQHTKAQCLTDNQYISLSYFNTAFGTRINIPIPEKEYPQVCFDYIHYNPVKAGIIASPEQWEFSSAADYAGKRNGTLIDMNVANRLGLLYDKPPL
jgi:putative transposase